MGRNDSMCNDIKMEAIHIFAKVSDKILKLYNFILITATNLTHGNDMGRNDSKCNDITLLLPSSWPCLIV